MAAVAELYVNVDGKMAPLAKCTWVFSHRCGHPFGVMIAQLSASSRDTYATEDQAWREFYDTAARRKAAQRAGVTARLAVHASLDDEFWWQMKDGCDCTPEVNRRGK